MTKILTEDAWREERSRLAARFIGKLGKEAHLVWRNYLKARVWGAYEDNYTPDKSVYRDYRLFANAQARAEKILRIRGYSPPEGFNSDELQIRWENPPKTRPLN